MKSLEDSFFAVEVSKDDVEEVIARWTGIPIQSIKQEEAKKLLADRNRTAQTNYFAASGDFRAGAERFAVRAPDLKNPNKPVGSFLFLGPTGVGKTEVARSLAEFLFGSERALDSVRYVGIYGKTHGRQIYRLAVRDTSDTKKADN